MTATVGGENESGWCGVGVGEAGTESEANLDPDPDPFTLTLTLNLQNCRGGAPPLAVPCAQQRETNLTVRVEVRVEAHHAVSCGLQIDQGRNVPGGLSHNSIHQLAVGQLSVSSRSVGRQPAGSQPSFTVV